LSLYKNKKNLFLDKNKKFFEADKNKEEKKRRPINYNILLENFITIYQLFYEDPSHIEKSRLINIKLFIINLINNKNDLISYMKFISDKFYPLYIVLTSNKKEDKLIVERRLIESKSIDFNNDFKILYMELIKKEENYGFILNFSQIFNYLYDNNSNVYYNLVFLKKLYSKELIKCPDKDLENKFKESIDLLGFDLIRKGDYNNNFLINFIINNDYYKSKKWNNNEKKFSIINKFKIKEMNDIFWNIYQEKKIYSFFEENLKNYVKEFCNKISEIKYIEYFFKLLPPEKYDSETIILIKNWLFENIQSYSKDFLTELLNGVQTIIEIMLKKKLISSIIEILELIKNNIGESFKILIIFLFHTIKEIKNDEINRYMIKSILYDNIIIDENDLNYDILENINVFLKEIKPNKIIKKIFLSEIEKFSITYDDFFNENLKSDLFIILLNNDDYSLLNDEINKKSLYWTNTLYTCKNLAKNLEELNIQYMDLKNIFCLLGENKIIERIIAIFKCLNSKNYHDKAINVKRQIDNGLKKIENNLKMIEDLKAYNNFIIYNNSEENEELSKYNKKMATSTVQYINSEENEKEFSKYDERVKRAREILKFKNSYIFLSIFNNIKNKIKGEKAIDIAIEKMKNLKKYL